MFSGASDGDLRPRFTAPEAPGASDTGVDASALEVWFASTVGGAWSGPRPPRPPGSVTELHCLRQVHGGAVVVVETAGRNGGRPDGRPRAVCAGTGDALVGADPSIALCMFAADCGAIALAGDNGVFAAVHAGWRGLVAGVIPATVQAMRALGASRVTGTLGPCIHPGCYEFSEGDLSAVASVLGEGVRARTASGRPAFDLPAAVSLAFASSGVQPVPGVAACTACSEGYFSHRARGDAGRNALVVWSSAGPVRRSS